MIRTEPEPGSAPQWDPGREQTVEAAGRSWRLSRADRNVWREFARWAKSVLPCPIEALARNVQRISLADAAVIRELLTQDAAAQQAAGGAALQLAPLFAQVSEVMADRGLAKAAARLNFGSGEMMDLLSWYDARVKMVYLLLQRHQPEVTEDQADDVANEVGPRRFAELFMAASGSVPPAPKKAEAPADSTPSPPPPGSEPPTGTRSTATSCATTP